MALLLAPEEGPSQAAHILGGMACPADRSNLKMGSTGVSMARMTIT